VAELGQRLFPRFFALVGDEGVHLSANILSGGFPGAEAGLIILSGGAVESGSVVALPHGSKKRLKAVVVGLRDRVELVIVAASASEGHTEKGNAGRIGQIVEDLLAPLFQVGGIVLVGPEPIETRRNKGVRIFRLQLVAGDL